VNKYKSFSLSYCISCRGKWEG